MDRRLGDRPDKRGDCARRRMLVYEPAEIVDTAHRFTNVGLAACHDGMSGDTEMDDDEQSPGSSSDPPIAAYNAGAVGWLYRAITVAGIVMAICGVAAELHFVGEVKSGLWPIVDVPSALFAGEASALTTLGIWVLLAGPVLALISMFVTGIRRRSWPAVILSGLVLTVIIVAVPTMSLIEGGL